MNDSLQRFPRPLAWLAARKWGRDLAVAIYTPLDTAAFRLTGGRRGLSPTKTVLFLTTTGRKSGQPRTVPLLFLRDGETFWVVASNYGQEKHPAWSANLLANPAAEVTIAGEKRQVRARLATDAEKAGLWPRLLRLYPSWNRYREWTDRDFRLFALDPLPPA